MEPLQDIKDLDCLELQVERMRQLISIDIETEELSLDFIEEESIVGEQEIDLAFPTI